MWPKREVRGQCRENRARGEQAGQEVAYRWIEANDWGPGAILHAGATRWESKGVGF